MKRALLIVALFTSPARAEYTNMPLTFGIIDTSGSSAARTGEVTIYELTNQ